jgi:hypothetical protein
MRNKGTKENKSEDRQTKTNKMGIKRITRIRRTVEEMPTEKEREEITRNTRAKRKTPTKES